MDGGAPASLHIWSIMSLHSSPYPNAMPQSVCLTKYIYYIYVHKGLVTKPGVINLFVHDGWAYP